MFRAHVLIVRKAKLYYTVSGIITPIGGHHVHRMATYRCDGTRDCIIQFCPPDDEHMCSKNVEAWNKLIINFSASSWLILRNIRYTYHLAHAYTHDAYITCSVLHKFCSHFWCWPFKLMYFAIVIWVAVLFYLVDWYKQFKGNLCSSGIWGSLEWMLVTDIVGQPISPIFIGQVGPPKDGTDILSGHIGNKLPIHSAENPRRVQILFVLQ